MKWNENLKMPIGIWNPTAFPKDLLKEVHDWTLIFQKQNSLLWRLL